MKSIKNSILKITARKVFNFDPIPLLISRRTTPRFISDDLGIFPRKKGSDISQKIVISSFSCDAFMVSTDMWRLLLQCMLVVRRPYLNNTDTINDLDLTYSHLQNLTLKWF